MDTPSTMIERLRLAMQKRNIRQRTVALSLNVNDSIVSHWMNLREHISPKHYPKICAILNISMSWFVDGVGPMEPITIQNELETFVITLLRTQNVEVQNNLLFILKNWRALAHVTNV